MSNGLKRSAKARRFYRFWWLTLALAPVVAVILIARASGDRLKQFDQLGLTVPAVAALLSLVIVLSMRLTWGRFSNERRKGVMSASSAVIGVRLWAFCFALLLGGMLLSAIVARLPDSLSSQFEESPKSIETQIELSSNQTTPTEATVKVTR